MSLIHKFKQDGNYFVLDVNTGAVHIVDEMVYDILDDDKLRNKSEILRDLVAKYDEEELRAVIQKHYDHTNSEVAKDILDNFGEQVSMFKKVVPHDYKHMIELIKYYEKQGLTNEQAKVEAFNEARKGV